MIDALVDGFLVWALWMLALLGFALFMHGILVLAFWLLDLLEK